MVHTVPFVRSKRWLRAEAITASYPNRRVLSQVDLSISTGGHICLVGPNGAGKSTLLMAMKGALGLDGGRILLAGDPIWPFDPRIGLVLANPEDQGVSPIVGDDVAFGPENLGRPVEEIHQAVEASLKAVGMWDLRNAPIRTLSGGQLQKVAVASALAMGAQFLLLDEATSMLSPWDRDSLMLALGNLRRRGLGIIHVTHQPEDVLWADEVLALSGGRVCFHGGVSDFFAWEGCPWDVPGYEVLRQGLREEGIASPSYAEIVAWLGGV